MRPHGGLTGSGVRRRLVLAPLVQHKGRLLLSVFAIALGVALGYAVQLVNQAAINEFALAVQSLSGEADLSAFRNAWDRLPPLQPVPALMEETGGNPPQL